MYAGGQQRHVVVVLEPVVPVEPQHVAAVVQLLLWVEVVVESLLVPLVQLLLPVEVVVVVVGPRSVRLDPSALCRRWQRSSSLRCQSTTTQQVGHRRGKISVRYLHKLGDISAMVHLEFNQLFFFCLFFIPPL